ncbi:beta-1,6-N-acetylglucosaminyltransferase [Conchiformibius kuhniae]|uniref:Peptide O-xylosyltransferase n=1 Tax=Conchiformibius kuhniae TaxID=211502 RepID=A0A8T9MT13_9NEIS|nr:beta-1,6-N-acetylglucosaminyltransferase [Conchiformibius kuhniae]UOP04747.1 beta-1,6-N-acetylglucosaminyltransferase [Conchiformibius kuhniae]
MNTAYLMLCHRPPQHLSAWAQREPQARFYLHYDAKSDITELHALRQISNIYILNNRVAVNWGGFSMILATLNLFQAALAEPANRYFHLLSGECLPLQNTATLEAAWSDLPAGTLFLQSRTSRRLRHRVRFNAPHADTAWQRKWHGKVLTKLLQGLDYLLPTKQICHVGSQWFSADRVAAEPLFQEALSEPSSLFEKKLCPDEHFFQHIVHNVLPEKSINHINDNRRLIAMHGSANHPDYLDLAQLRQARQNGLWFARKVDDRTAQTFLAEQY